MFVPGVTVTDTVTFIGLSITRDYIVTATLKFNDDSITPLGQTI